MRCRHTMFLLLQLEQMEAVLEKYQNNIAAAEAALQSSQSEVEALKVSSILLSLQLLYDALHPQKRAPIIPPTHPFHPASLQSVPANALHAQSRMYSMLLKPCCTAAHCHSLMSTDHLNFFCKLAQCSSPSNTHANACILQHPQKPAFLQVLCALVHQQHSN